MKTWAFIAATVWSVLIANNDGHAAPPDGYREHLLEVISSVHAWRIEYETIVPPDVKEAPVIHRIVAMKEPNSIYHFSTKYGSGTGLTWQDDPLQQRSIISKHRNYWEFPLRRAFRVTETDDQNLFPGSLSQDLLWGAVTWWPITCTSNHLIAAEPYVVVDVLRSETFHFRDEIEDVGGTQCYALESSGRSVLWFDAKRIGALVAREFYSKDTGVPTWRIEMSKFNEIKPGLWCPTELRNIQYNYNAPTKEGRRRQDVDAAFKVLDVRLNEDVPDELFEIPEPKPGAMQAFKDGSYKQVVPGGYDYMDETLDWIKRNVKYEKPASKVSVAEIVFHVAAIAISLYIIYSCWKSRQPSKR
jgi:hypothetical protein